MFLFNLCLKALRLGAERISSGSSFQSRIADGKIELELSCELVRIVCKFFLIS